MSTPFHIYLDLEVRNDDTFFTSLPQPPLNFEETRTQPFLDGDASEYFCTIARFTLQTGNSLPLFIPAIDTKQTSVILPEGRITPPQNVTIYKISFWELPEEGSTVRGQLLQQNVVYQPSDYSAPLPQPPTGPEGQDLRGEYYYVRSYQDFINMINLTLMNLYNRIIVPTGGVTRYNPPYMEWDNTSCTATLYADSYCFDLNPRNPFIPGAGRSRKFEIYFDARLYQLFSSLNATYVGGGPGIGGMDYRLDIFGDSSNTVLAGKDSAQGQMYSISLSQEVSTIAVWTPVEAIVFTSSSLPIHPALSSTPKVISAGQFSITGSGVPNLANVLTDFQIAVSPTNQYRPEISYTPQGEYRLIDMYSNRNLSRVDLQVYWRDKQGNLRPLPLYPGCSASVKLLFRHKGFYLGMDM